MEHLEKNRGRKTSENDVNFVSSKKQCQIIHRKKQTRIDQLNLPPLQVNEIVHSCYSTGIA